METLIYSSSLFTEHRETCLLRISAISQLSHGLWSPLTSDTAGREESAGRWAIDWTPQQEKEEEEPFSFSLTGMGFVLQHRYVFPMALTSVWSEKGVNSLGQHTWLWNCVLNSTFHSVL